MNIHEYQAKGILAEYGIAVPKSKVATTGDAARAAATELGGTVVVKAQVHAGGRGKGGGVKLAKNPAEADEIATEMLGSQLVTPQTGSEGVPVDRVLVEQGLDIASEIYLSVIIDGELGRPVVVASAEGGMDIEKLSEERPDAIRYAEADPLMGLSPYKVRELVADLGMEGDLAKRLVDIILKLYRVFIEKDCTLVEVNPLVVTASDYVYAADAKLNIEDDALFRHPDLHDLRDLRQLEPLEKRATLANLSYVKLSGGEVGCVVNGAGLAMATMDITSTVGAQPANFLDIGGSARQERIEEAFGIVLEDADVKAVLVNLFAGIARADIVASGIVAAAKRVDKVPPIVVAMRGTSATEGTRILNDSGLRVEVASDLVDATEKLHKVLKELKG